MYVIGSGNVIDDSELSNRNSASVEGFATDLNLGYRFWFVNKDKFKMGLTCGSDFSVPIYGTFTATKSGAYRHEEYSENIRDGFISSLSVGLVFNFGKTGFSKSKNKDSSAKDVVAVSTGVPAFESSELYGKWNPFEDKNKKAVGYFEFNEDGTGYFKYVPDGKNAVADGAMNWQLIEKNGKTFVKITNHKLKDVNNEWECSLTDGVLMFKKQLCFGVYPNNKWTKE